MRMSIVTEQLLAIQDHARKMLALVKTESRREMAIQWENAQKHILENILTSLESIDTMDVKVFADWLDKYRLLNHFLSIIHSVEGEAKEVKDG